MVDTPRPPSSPPPRPHHPQQVRVQPPAQCRPVRGPSPLGGPSVATSLRVGTGTGTGSFSLPVPWDVLGGGGGRVRSAGVYGNPLKPNLERGMIERRSGDHQSKGESLGWTNALDRLSFPSNPVCSTVHVLSVPAEVSPDFPSSEPPRRRFLNDLTCQGQRVWDGSDGLTQAHPPSTENPVFSNHHLRTLTTFSEAGSSQLPRPPQPPSGLGSICCNLGDHC